MPERKWLLWLTVCAFLYLLAATLNANLLQGEKPLQLWDFCSYYFAAQRVSIGLPLYDHSVSPWWVYPYVYFPPLAFYCIPLCSLQIETACLLWLLLLAAAAMFIFIDSLLLPLPPGAQAAEKKHARALLALLLFIALPFDNNLHMGQVNILVAACIVLSLRQYLMAKRDFAAGLLLAPAVLVKMTPAGLLVFYALNKRYKPLAGCAAGMILFAIPSLVTQAGRNTWREFFDFAENIGYGQSVPGLFSAAHVANFSLAGCLARFTPDAGTVSLLTYILVAVLGSGLLIQHVRLRRKGTATYLLLPYLILMVVSSPLTYLHHVIYIYPGLFLVCGKLLGCGGRRRTVLLICMLAVALVASINFPDLYAHYGFKAPGWRALNLYALVILFFLGLLAPAWCSERNA